MVRSTRALPLRQAPKSRANERPEDEISSATSESDNDDASIPSTKRRRYTLQETSDEDRDDDGSPKKHKKTPPETNSPVIDLSGDGDLSEDDAQGGTEDDDTPVEAKTPSPPNKAAKTLRNSYAEDEMKERFAKLKRSLDGPVRLSSVREKDPVLAEWMENSNGTLIGIVYVSTCVYISRHF